MKLIDRTKVYELFEGLEIDHLVGKKEATLHDLRHRFWTILKLTNTVAYEEGSGIAFANITSDVIRNDNTGDILMLAEGDNKLLIVIYNVDKYVRNVEAIKLSVEHYKQ
jgi:hypothetical protein